jgi:serine/threonine-protein kinase
MVAGNLGHKNIVTVYEYGTHEDRPFLAMEYLEGQDLHQIISSRAPLSLLNKCNIMSQVADGLYCAHQSGVVHRDMKPANIKVLPDGTAKIMDFGIARLTSAVDATRLTQQGFLIGTLRYMSPEQLAGAEFTALCDIFAYGVIYYELLTGKHPFEASDAQSLMYKLTTSDPRPIREVSPSLPAALEPIVARLLQKNPAARYQSLKEVQFDTEPVRIDLQKGRATELLGEAQGHFQSQRFDAAQKALDEALALEPANRSARALWEQLQRQLQLGTRQPRTDSVLRDKVSQLLAEARRELEQQNLTAAYRIVSEALRHDPKNSEAAEFLKTMQAYLERRQAEQRVDEVILKARGLLLLPAYDEAIALLTASGPDADSPRIREFLERVHREKTVHERRQKLRSEMAHATDLLRDHRFEEAVACLEQLHTDFSEDQDVAHLLDYARKERASLARAKAIETLAGEVRTRLESQDFEAALSSLDRALQEYPGESGLIRLLETALAAKNARDAVRQVCDRANQLLAERQPEAAVAAVQQALAQYPSDPALEEILRHAQEAVRAREQARAITRIVQEAALHTAAQKFDDALAALDQALETWPDHAELLRQRAATLEAQAAWAQEAARAEALEKEASEKRQRALEDLEQIRRLSLQVAGAAKAAELLSRAVQIASQLANEVEVQTAAAEPIALLSDIGRARQELVHGNFVACLEISRRYLTQYPDHPAFRALQSEAEFAERRSAIAEVHRRAAAEPNLRKRTLILEEAIREFADEVALAEELQLNRNKLALIDSIVERARLCEQAGQWEEALEKWRSLQAIDHHPGLDSAIERVRLAKDEAFARAIERRMQPVEEALEAGDLGRATDLLRQAQVEHPGSPQLEQLSSRIEEIGEKRKRARELLARAEASSQTGNPGEYQTCLRQAFQMDESDAAFRKLVLNKLIDQAQSAIQTDWRQAEALVGEATALQPGFHAPGAVLRAIAERKREAAVPPLPKAAMPARARARLLVAIALLAAGIGTFVALRFIRRPAPVAGNVYTRVPAASAPSAAESCATPTCAEPPARNTSTELPSVPVPESPKVSRKREEKPPMPLTPPVRQPVLNGGTISAPQVRLDGPVPTETDKPKTARPAPPDPKQIEAQEWDQIAGSTNPDDFDRFLRNHPGGAHQEQARNRAAELRQQSTANVVRQVEQAFWERLDRNNREQIEEYLSRFPAGAHAPEARERIAELDRQAAESFAAQRQRELKEQERVKSAADQQAIAKVVQDFEAAYNLRDLASLQTLWEGAPITAYQNQFREAKQLVYQLQPTGQPFVAGNSATVTCTRTLFYKGQSGGSQTHTDRVKVTLSREPSGWLIRAISLN